MTVEEAVVQVLRADGTLAALVGQRVRPAQGEETDPPGVPTVVYSVQQDQGLQAMKGNMLATRSCLFRLDCYGGPTPTEGAYRSAGRVAAAAATAILAEPLRTVTSGAESLAFKGVFDEGRDAERELALFGDARGADFVSQLLEIWYSAA